MSAASTEDSIFVVATVPPPPGEVDAYSAGTKVQAPPVALMELLARQDAEAAAAGLPSGYVACLEVLEGESLGEADLDPVLELDDSFGEADLDLLLDVSQVIEVATPKVSTEPELEAFAPILAAAPRRASVQTVAWAVLASLAAAGACTAAAFAFVI